MKNILISGAEGYISLHLIKTLKEHGYHVITASRHQCSDIYMDFSKPEQIVNLKIDGIDAMIHTVSPNESLFKNDIYQAVSESSIGIHSALDFCVKNQIKNFIYFSSFHVFGNREGILDETTPVTPCNDYGLAHYIAEQTVQMYNRQKKLNAWIIRPSNLFGVPVDCNKFRRWNLIPFAFCKEAVEHKRITLLTPGNQLRNFVGINDVCRIVLWILEKAPSQRLIHAFGNETMSILEYAQQVRKVALQILKIPVEIIHPMGLNDVIHFKFTSIHNFPEIQPNDNLTVFINEMLRSIVFTTK